MASIRRALAFAMAERYLLIALALGSNLVVARLLTPAQIGIYSVTMAVIAIAQVVRDFGVGSYLIQQRNLEEAHIRTAFGVSLVLGAALFTVVWFGASAAAAFYREAQMVSTMRILAVNFLILPASTLTLGLLRREMTFKPLAAINVIAASAGVAATLTCAFTGWGANSMAIGSVVTSCAAAAGGWIAMPQRILTRPALSEWRSVLGFGGQSSASGIVSSISMDANDLVVGKILGFQEVALLSRAQGLMNVIYRDIMSAVRGVALPAYAAAHRKEDNLHAQYIKSVALTTVFAWPLYGTIACYPLEMLRLLYGPQWDAARTAVVIFCLAGTVAAPSSLVPTLLVAIGRVDLIMRFDLVMQPLRLLLILVAASTFRSVEACAVALVIVSALSVPTLEWLRSQAAPGYRTAWLIELSRSAAVGLATLVPAMIHVALVGSSRTEPESLLTIGPILLASCICWIVACVVVRHPIAQEPAFKSAWSIAVRAVRI